MHRMYIPPNIEIEQKLTDLQENVMSKLKAGISLYEYESMIIDRGSKKYEFVNGDIVHHQTIRYLLKNKFIKRDILTKSKTIGGYQTEIILN